MWQQTVMSDERVFAMVFNCKGSCEDAWREINEAQAEITWKARDKEVAEAKQAAIREVVEWMKDHVPHEYDSFSFWSEWQAFLKEKGLLIKIGESCYTEEELADLRHNASDDTIG